MSIIPECADYLNENAIGQWFESYRFKKDDDYLHPVNRDMVLLRVELNSKRAFYWIYNIDDALAFNRYVGISLKGEAHEIIIANSCRFFYDIDLQLSAFEQEDFAEHYGLPIDSNESMDILGRYLANLFKEATIISLEEHGNDVDDELYGFDWMYTMRNRPTANGFKISIHLITNIFVSLRACAAIAEDVKHHAILNNVSLLGITEDMATILCEAIDETQYRPRGSLGLPYGTKLSNGDYRTSFIDKEYAIPNQYYFITIDDAFALKTTNLSQYNIIEKNLSGATASPEFVQEALKHINNVKDYNPRVWDINASILKRSTMYVKRHAPSMCSVCDRVHDNDNTLFLIFNSDRGIASWKCSRMPSMKPIVFYTKEIVEASSSVGSDDEIEAFANKYRKAATRSKMNNDTLETKQLSDKNLLSKQLARDDSSPKPPAQSKQDWILQKQKKYARFHVPVVQLEAMQPSQLPSYTGEELEDEEILPTQPSQPKKRIIDYGHDQPLSHSSDESDLEESSDEEEKSQSIVQKHKPIVGQDIPTDDTIIISDSDDDGYDDEETPSSQPKPKPIIGLDIPAERIMCLIDSESDSDSDGYEDDK